MEGLYIYMLAPMCILLIVTFLMYMSGDTGGAFY